MTIDRHFVGDVGLAILLALPTLALARPEPDLRKDTAPAVAPLVEKAALAERIAIEQRFSLAG